MNIQSNYGDLVMMALYFIRHAQSENNSLLYGTLKESEDIERTKIFEQKRDTDPVLTDIGRMQAEVLASFIKKQGNHQESKINNVQFYYNMFDFTHIYVSPMIRALDTVYPLAKSLDLNPTVWEDLHEMGGVWSLDVNKGEKVGKEGISPAQLKQNYPKIDVPSSMNPSGWWNRPHEGHQLCIQRSKRVLGELLKKHLGTYNRIALITHSGFLNYLFFELFDLPTDKGVYSTDSQYFFCFNNASITRVDFYKNDVKGLVYINRTDYLSEKLLT